MYEKKKKEEKGKKRDFKLILYESWRNIKRKIAYIYNINVVIKYKSNEL